MKIRRYVYRGICIAAVLLAAVLVYGASTAKGNGFLDLSNVVGYFLYTAAALLAAIGVTAGIFGWRR
mgnify:FL=1